MAEQYVMCPKCGHAFDAADPRVRKLTPATFHFWENTPSAFRLGAIMGPSELARRLDVSRELAYYHLRRLAAAGLVQRIPVHPHATPPQRHVYAGVPLHPRAC